MNEQELTKIIKRLLRICFAVSSKDVSIFIYYEIGDQTIHSIEAVFSKEFVEMKYFDKFRNDMKKPLRNFELRDWWIRESEITLELFPTEGKENERD